MLSKSPKWELDFVHYIKKFTISRFIISRFECTNVLKTKGSQLKLMPLLKSQMMTRMERIFRGRQSTYLATLWFKNFIKCTWKTPVNFVR